MRKFSRMAAIALAFALIAASLPSPASAAQSGNLLYKIVGNAVEITGYTGRGGTVTVPAVIGGKRVTSIGEGAFDNKSITGVVLPNSITKIGEYAFGDCSKLSSINLPDSILSIGPAAFSSCTALTSVVLPKHIMEINNNTFQLCEKLSSIQIPQGVMGIGDYAFNFCYSLKNITIPKSVTNIGFCAFDACTSLKSINIPSNIVTIGEYAFYRCSSLMAIQVDPANPTYSSVDGVLLDRQNGILIRYPAGLEGSYTVPDNVVEIGGEAFAGSKGLSDLYLPESLIQIDYYAFEDCTGLTEVEFSDGLEMIQNGAFGGCTGLTSVSLPGSVYDISPGAFGGCSSMAAITVSGSNGCYSSHGGVLFDKYRSELVIYPEGKAGAYVIPFGVTMIGMEAFGGCSGLSGITIPPTVYSIGEEAFSGCDSLTSVTIPLGVVEIGDWAFIDCTGIKTISIPRSVSSIGNRAFECAVDGINYEDGLPNCGNLVSIDVDPANQTYSSQDGVLYNKDKSTLIRYPSGRKETFAIPDGVKDIQDWAFAYSTGLTGVTFPESLTTIGQSAFMNCNGLKSVTFPGSIQSMAEGAFGDCKNLSKAVFEGAKPQTVDEAFGGCAPGFKIYYPISEAANWAGGSKYIPKQAYCIATLHLQISGVATKKMLNVTGGHVSAPAAARRAGYTFAGWYKEAACLHSWNFTRDIIKDDISLYAGWLKTPGNVVAESASYNSIRVSWTGDSNYTGYEIYRSSTEAGAYKLVGSSSSIPFTDTGLEAGSTYYYKVRGYKLTGTVKTYGEYSEAVSAKPAPATPVLTITSVSSDSIMLGWGAVDGASMYELYRADSINGTYRLLVSTAGLDCIDKNPNAGTTYFYKLRAYHLKGTTKVYGDYSEVVNATPTNK